MNKGIWFGIATYVLWGLLPVYWKWLHHVEAVQLVSHRIVWSFATLVIVILLMRQWKVFWTAAKTPRILRTYAIAAVLIAINWLAYIWAVNAGFLVETSLGYYINPLVSVLLGIVFLRERLRVGQWLPIGLATAGVLYLTFVHGSLPWIALTLAFSFGFYGLVKKTAPLGSIHGLTLETGVLVLPAFLFLLYSEMIGQGQFLHSGTVSDLLLAGTGVVTSIPLLLFASAARRIPLSVVGILQYISPTLQFVLGVFVYKEPFDATQLVGYVLVWTALVIFAVERLHAYRAQPVAVIAE
jgi:chloramphenicol-sensitive protein RarD